MRLNGRVDDHCANSTATARLLCLFGDFARKGDVVSCLCADMFLGTAQDLGRGCDGCSRSGGVENDGPEVVGPFFSLAEWELA
jgi:hypothetical protein